MEETAAASEAVVRAAEWGAGFQVEKVDRVDAEGMVAVVEEREELRAEGGSAVDAREEADLE